MKLQKKLAAEVEGVGRKRVKLDAEHRSTIKEAITKYDVRKLIRDHIIKILPERGVSKVRNRKRKIQKRKGRQRGVGSRKGKKTARSQKKRTWINKIRAQRKLLKSLKQKKLITNQDHAVLYKKAKGGFFRSVKHIKMYISENNMLRK